MRIGEVPRKIVPGPSERLAKFLAGMAARREQTIQKATVRQQEQENELKRRSSRRDR